MSMSDTSRYMKNPMSGPGTADVQIHKAIALVVPAVSM